MDLAHGLLMGIFGCLATFVGFFIAYLVASKNLDKKKVKREKGPLDDLQKDYPGWKGDDCQ